MSNYNRHGSVDMFRLAEDEVALKPPKVRGGKFIAGPIDVIWLSKARQLGVTALWVGLGLWFLRGLKRNNTFVVSNMMMREWGVEPDAKSRALRKLEAAGLIEVEARGRRSPKVTIKA